MSFPEKNTCSPQKTTTATTTTTTTTNTTNTNCEEWKIVHVILGHFVHCTQHPFLPHTNCDKEEPKLFHEEDSIVNVAPFLQIHLDHCMALCSNGMIRYFGSQTHYATQIATWCHDGSVQVQTLPQYSFCCPGFIDLHHHAPQYAYAGTATDKPLTGGDGWLEAYAFPTEQSLRDSTSRTKQLFSQVVHSTLTRGTTSIVYFGTLDVVPCQILVDVVLQYGQRAWVGKVCMDRNAPSDYCQSTQQNIQETKQLIQYIYHKAGKRNTTAPIATTTTSPLHHDCTEKKESIRLPLVFPLVTPRFIPTCTPELLTALGTLAQAEQLHITTHISESIDEVQWSHQLEPNDIDDTATLHRHGLLTRQSILAHGVWLSDTAASLLRQQQSSIAHCPLSNFFFANQSLPCRHLLEQGNSIGLGTDIAGGYDCSMFNACRCAVLASRVLDHQYHSPKHLLHLQSEATIIKKETTEQQQNNSKSLSASPSPSFLLDYRHAFYMATLGGANALNVQDHIGNFQVGKEFDAIVLTIQSNIYIHPEADTWTDIFQKLCNLADDRNVTHVFVAGKLVIGPKDPM